LTGSDKPFMAVGCPRVREDHLPRARRNLNRFVDHLLVSPLFCASVKRIEHYLTSGLK
jgi:hypothetical protein